MQSLFSRESKEHTCKNPHGVPMVTSRATSPKSNLQRQIFTVECFSILLNICCVTVTAPIQAVHTRDVYVSIIYPLHYFDQLSQLIMFN